MSYIPVINLGRQPKHANGYLTKEEIGTEEFFNMVIGYDPETDAIKLMETTPREVMFNDQYAFYSKTSKRMADHFAQTADDLKYFLRGDQVVVEIGSNDGIMQDAWMHLGKKCIGIEPSGNVAAIARLSGHTVYKEFVNPVVVGDIKERHNVGIVYAANVSCHITEFDEYLSNISRLIEKGIFVFEDPYFLDVYEKCSYDQFYGEHTWMFTVKFLQKKLADYGMEIFDLKPLWTHGGSMRYYVQRMGGRHIRRPVVQAQIEKEGNIEMKLHDLATRIEQSRIGLTNILDIIKDKNICGFGASSKGVVVTNFCGIGPDIIPFITDTTPTKIGKYYPGSHIPIVAQASTDYSKFDYIINFAWNHFEEIREFMKGKFNGKWITHVPYPRIV